MIRLFLISLAALRAVPGHGIDELVCFRASCCVYSGAVKEKNSKREPDDERGVFVV